MNLYKFVISNHDWVPDSEDKSLLWKGCIAVTLAETEEAARAHLARYAAENGFDARWLRVARVIPLPIQDGVVGAWAQV